MKKVIKLSSFAIKICPENIKMKRKSQRCKRNDFGNLAEPSKMEKLFF